MKIVIFKDSYFEGKVECDNLIECKKIIHDNPNTHVRVEVTDSGKWVRMLLKPSEDGRSREIEGYSNLALMYRYFNNLTEDALSQILCQETYISHIK